VFRYSCRLSSIGFGESVAQPTLKLTTRFVMVLLVLVPSLVGVAWIGSHGLASMRATADGLYNDNILTAEATSGLVTAVDDVHVAALSSLASDPERAQQLGARLVNELEPAVDVSLATVRARHADEPNEQRHLDEIAQTWGAFKTLWNTRSPTADRSVLAAQVDDVLSTLSTTSRALIGVESAHGKAAYDAALDKHQASRRATFAVLGLALIAGVGVVVWLIRSVLPRTLSCSRFAIGIAEGHFDQQLDVGGNDEITQLGRTLDTMARRRQRERSYEETQFEFTETMQLAEGEDEAVRLVKHHLERSIPASDVVILNRNNSKDRLEAATDLGAASSLHESLQGAVPRSCLAIRRARPEQQGNGRDPLIACPVCSECPGWSTCTPLLVGGEVIGSILITSPDALDAEHERRIRETVLQAAPVVGNLRNLAVAELRAATDSLTTLPNKRSIDDLLKSVVAQSRRADTPMATVLVDLDHFKQVNDRFGHPCGDEVLAGVGAALRSTLREGDFAGRYGGEEFVIVLPNTNLDGALTLCERLRVALAEIFVPTVEQRITASMGIAVLPDHAIDSDGLLRMADRALYSAKNNGRDRIEHAQIEEHHGGELDESVAATPDDATALALLS
jgi:diguanylate cyclase (GGDEF)-like protein